LVELGFLRRETPFGTPAQDAKRSLYRLADPLLDFFWRFVEPNRSRLGAGQHAAVLHAVKAAWPGYLGHRWEQLVRERIGRGSVFGTNWLPAQRYWGPSGNGAPIELDAVTLSTADPGRALVVECKLRVAPRSVPGALDALMAKARTCPALAGKRIEVALWSMHATGQAHPRLRSAKDVVSQE
jgi:hypothetical protein